MFDHVEIAVSDLEASERFYRTVLGTLGIEPSQADAELVDWGHFALVPTDDDHPVSRGLHVAFFAPTRAGVDAFWQAGVDAGHRDDGAPGPRPEYGPDYYGGFLLDPDGNSAEAVNLDDERAPGQIDHVWIRVADLAAARRFYVAIAPHSGFAAHEDEPGRAHFRGPGATFSLVAGGSRTRNVHLAFPAVDDEVVRAFHATALEAGATDNGGPGERPAYHAGYYAAFACDPDGNNVEVVNHNRA